MLAQGRMSLTSVRDEDEAQAKSEERKRSDVREGLRNKQRTMTSVCNAIQTGNWLSYKEHGADALALRAEERRDKLR